MGQTVTIEKVIRFKYSIDTEDYGSLELLVEKEQDGDPIGTAIDAYLDSREGEEFEVVRMTITPHDDEEEE